MDFNARQYDPQIGRFLSVDPLAAFGGQESYSPYAAMGNQPESNIDPNGLQQFNLMAAQAVTPENGDQNFRRAQALMMGGNYGGAGATYHGGGSSQRPNFPPGFRALGMTSTTLNTFWDILPPSMKAYVNDQYDSHERHMQFVRDQTEVNNERFDKGNKGYQTAGTNELGEVQVTWHYGEPYHGIKVYQKSWMSGGITLPPAAIIVEKDAEQGLLEHEYGHKLYYDANGFWSYYTHIAIPSLYNAMENSLDKKSGLNLSVKHKYYYTETDANTRAQEYFLPGSPINAWPNNSQTRTVEYPADIRALMYIGYGITKLLGQ